MQRSSSLFAHAARTSRLKDLPVLPLDFFVNKSKSLSLYRAFIRSSKGFGKLEDRLETVAWIRVDFEKYRGLLDSEKSKTLLALGNRQLKQLNSTGMLLGPEGAKFRGGRKP